MSAPQDLLLLVHYGEGREVEVKVPAEFTVDRAKKAILAKLPELGGGQTSEYLLSIAGAFLTTEFSKLGALEAVRESDHTQPIAVTLLRRVKIKGAIVSPRNGHIASNCEVPRRHSHGHSTDLLPVSEESLEHAAEEQELRIEIAKKDKLIAEQRREITTLRSHNDELMLLLESHGIQVPAGIKRGRESEGEKQRPVSEPPKEIPALTISTAYASTNKTDHEDEDEENEKKNESDGGPGTDKEDTKALEKQHETMSTEKKQRPISDGGKRKETEEAASPVSPVSPKTKEAKKKQKAKEKERSPAVEKRDKEETKQRKKKFSWKSAGKKQGAAMKDALVKEETTTKQEDEPEEKAGGEAENVDKNDDDAKPQEAGDGKGASSPTSSPKSGNATPDTPGTPTKGRAGSFASAPSSPSTAPAAKTTSLASDDSRQKRSSLTNIWRKGKNKDRSSTDVSSSSSNTKSPVQTPPDSPFPGIRFHHPASSLDDVQTVQPSSDDQSLDNVANAEDLLAAMGGGAGAMTGEATEEAVAVAAVAAANREGRSGSGSGSGLFGKRNKKKGNKEKEKEKEEPRSRSSSGRLIGARAAHKKDEEKEEKAEEEEERDKTKADGKISTDGGLPISELKLPQLAEAVALAGRAEGGSKVRERSESGPNGRRGTLAFYEAMRVGAEKLVVGSELGQAVKSEAEAQQSENDHKKENGEKNEGSNSEKTEETKDEDLKAEKEGENETHNAATEAEEAKVDKKPERKLTPEEHAQKIREEFIKTEEKYTQNLDILLTRYMTPLRLAAASSSEEERVIALKEASHPSSTVEKIFSRELSLLQTMHSHLLKEIKESTNSTEFIDAFFSFTYTLYVNNFSHSNKALSELIKSNAKLQKFIQDTYEKLNKEFVKESTEDKMSDNQTQVDLRGLLIMPIQRLPRYELLLRDLAKHTSESGVEHEKLEKLLKDVQKVNHHINEAKRKDENTNKLVEIQNAIKTKGDKAFTLFDRVGRQFVREGKLETRELQTDPTKKVPGFARAYVFLFDDLLVVTKPEKGGADAPHTYRLVEIYTLSGFTASLHFELASAEGEEKEKDRIISLVPIEKDGRTVQLKAHSTSDRQIWLDDISRHIQHALQRVLGTTPPVQRKGAA